MPSHSAAAELSGLREARPRIAAEGAISLVLVGVASTVVFRLTATRCDTDPVGDTDSTWRFSGYCKALHSQHLFNYPDNVSGGGLLEGLFVLPVVVSLTGLAYALRCRRISPVRTALYVSGALIVLPVIAAVSFASASFPGDG